MCDRCSREQYFKAVDFLAMCEYVHEEAVELIANLFGTPIDVVRADIKATTSEKRPEISKAEGA